MNLIYPIQRYNIWLISLFLIGMLSSNVNGQNKARSTFLNETELHGRIHFDLNFVNSGDTMENSSSLRRIRLSLRGPLAPKFQYKLQADLHSGKFQWRDAFVQYKSSKYGSLAIGNKLEPTGLSRMNGSNYISLMERPNLVDLHWRYWAPGIHYSNFNLLNKQLGIQLAYTFNSISNSPTKAANIGQDGNVLLRLSSVWGMAQDNHALIHIGLNAESRKQSNLDTYQISYYPGNFSGQKIYIEYPAHDKSVQRNALGLEAAIQYEAFLFQGEYKHFDLNIAEHNLDGYYASLSYVFGSFQRQYKKGAFGRINMPNDFSQLKDGTFEIVLRYSTIHAKSSNNTFQDKPINGNTHDMTFGLNWYLTSNIRVMYNYVFANLETQEPNEDINVFSHMLRLQGDF